MEFTEIFNALAVVLVMIVAIFGLTATWNLEYGSTLGEDAEFNETLSKVTTLLEDEYVDEGLVYAGSTQPVEGQGSATTQQDGMIKRALRSIGLIDNLIGVIPALIKDGSEALNLNSIFWRIGQSAFWITFAITLAYLLILGARRLI